MSKRIVVFVVLILGLLLTSGIAGAGVEPTPFITYQGVLRDAADNPLDGGHEMTFRFFDAGELGNEILVDEHHGDAAIVAQSGMFSAALGSGTVLDGSGGGTYTSLAEVFRDYADVYLQVEIWNADGAAWEILDPRTRVFSAAYALNCDHLDGNDDSFFLNTSSADQTKDGRLFLETPGGYALQAFGTSGGVYAGDSNSSGYGFVGNGHYGVMGYGNTSGGYFQDADHSGRAYAGVGDRGVQGDGDSAGAYFYDSNDSGYSYVGSGHLGIEGRGNTAGGYFVDRDNGGNAYVGYNTYGIYASSPVGGYFEDSNGSGYGWFGYGDYGVWALGNTAGGRFHDFNQSGIALVGYGDRGIWAKGDFAGGTFSHPDNTTFWADVSTSTRKITGTGTVSFVQNHPQDPGKVIVYAAPEGDEVATYTRGSARLAGGEARVSLGETFRWVTNPDIGLTAHLTPRGECGGLYVASLSTTELVVRELDGGTGDVTFDFIVYGLRLGFEDLAVLQKKEKEAFLPAFEAIEADYEGAPELRAHSALSRFRDMRLAVGGSGEPDLAGARSLVAALEEQRAVTMTRLAGSQDSLDALPARPVAPDAPVSEAPAVTGRAEPDVAAISPATNATVAAPIPGARTRPLEGSFELMPVRGGVQPGDVLVLDKLTPGAVRTSTLELDRAVAGCAVAPDEEAFELPGGHTAVGLSGIVLCRVDASFGAIGVGDLLTTSTNPGHAMLAGEYARGAVLGKAVEPLAEGSGLIKVLVMLR